MRTRGGCWCARWWTSTAARGAGSARPPSCRTRGPPRSDRRPARPAGRAGPVAARQRDTGSNGPRLRVEIGTRFPAAATSPHLAGKTIVLGVIDLSDPAVETVAERVRRALPYVDAENVVLAPDCGMKYLPRESADGRMRAMVDAAELLRAGQGTRSGRCAIGRWP